MRKREQTNTKEDHEREQRHQEAYELVFQRKASLSPVRLGCNALSGLCTRCANCGLTPMGDEISISLPLLTLIGSCGPTLWRPDILKGQTFFLVQVVMLVKTSVSSKFFFFDAVTHVLTAVTSSKYWPDSIMMFDLANKAHSVLVGFRIFSLPQLLRAQLAPA